MAQQKSIATHIVDFGILRILLIMLAIVLMVLRFWADAEVSYGDWNMIPTLIAPALVPIVFMGLWLDVIMCFVFKSDKTGAARKKYKIAIATDVTTVLTMLLVWLTFFTNLGSSTT